MHFILNINYFIVITDNLRTILHEGSTNMRIQYDIESLFKIINEDFAGYQGVPQELDIVEEGDQVIHDVDLETELNVQDNISKHILIYYLLIFIYYNYNHNYISYFLFNYNFNFNSF